MTRIIYTDRWAGRGLQTASAVKIAFTGKKRFDGNGGFEGGKHNTNLRLVTSLYRTATTTMNNARAAAKN